MLRINQSVNAAAAKQYYTDLSKGDYYAEGGQSKGRWGGQGAKLLKLEGNVEREAFANLADNRLPDGSGRLTARTKLSRRVGYDINYHCPKSVSVMHALTGDERIVEAVNWAVDETMQQMEADIRTRVRMGGQQAERPSPNLIWAKFVHMTTRPVDGIPDPHIHAHCFTFNATFDPVEQRWKAIDLAAVKSNAPFYEAAFHARLAQRLVEVGYAVERRGRFWELAAVPESVNGKFSRRTAQIDRVAAERGITDPVRKAELGAKTRRSKTEARPWPEVVRNWNGRLTDEERGGLAAPERSPDPEPFSPGRRTAAAREALNYGLGVALERASIACEERVLEHALRYGVGRVRVEDVQSELSRLDLIRRTLEGQNYITTAAILAEEQAMIDFARDGRGACQAFASEAKAPDSLKGSQVQAFQSLVSSPDRVTLVRGPAGAGKTTLMQAVIPAIEEHGTPVTVLAAGAATAREELPKRGFTAAETVARFLGSERLQAEAKGGVIWVDEAGQLGVRTVGKLFEASKSLNTRVILSGDYRQHASVERGDTLRLLESQAGLRSAEIREIQRQRGEYRKAMTDLSRGKTKQGFDRLDRLGAIREMPEADDRYPAVAEAYAKSAKLGKSVLAVSPTHREASAVTEAIRGRLKADGQLGEEREFLQLRSLELTEAERGVALHYLPGHLVQFHKSAAGFRAGARTVVTDVDAEHNWVNCSTGGLPTPLPLEAADRFTAYARERIPVAVGDTIRVTRNGRTADGGSAVSSGTRHKVAGFDEHGGIVLSDGRVLASNFGHIDHGYCSTSYGAQGASAEKVLVVQSQASYRAASKAQFYVAASRGVRSIEVFTDDKAKLFEATQRDAARMSALELAKPEVAGLWMARASEEMIRTSTKVLDVGLER